MISIDYLVYPIVINMMKDFNFDIHIYYLPFIGILYLFITNKYLQKNIKQILSEYFCNMFNKNTNKIIIKNEEKDRSIKFKALMYYLEKNYNSSINKICDDPRYVWNRDDDRIEREGVYEICQTTKFKFTDKIYGKIQYKQIEERRVNDRYDYKNLCNLIIMSDTLSLNDMKKWIDCCIKDYKYYIKMKSCDNQLLLSINYNEKEKHIDIEKSEWESTVTFNNSYFQHRDEILEKINFFLNNKEWYYEKGIPYNLGILLYGEPGCGKTRFIKQLMNHTGRHGIDIKLNDTFDFTKLKDIIYNEEIEDEYVIPQNKRIIIFEDIDAIGDVIKDRDILDKKSSDISSDEEENPVVIINKKLKNKSMNSILSNIEKKKNTNNLSYFLNILDGLNECSGRIIIMTTNKIDHLDKALIRPGRIDIKINFTKCSCYDIYMMIKTFWGEDTNIQLDDINKEIHYKYTSAEIINLFRSSTDFESVKQHFI